MKRRSIIVAMMAVILVAIPSGVSASPTCTEGVLGATSISGACTAALGAVSAVCPVAIMSGGMEPISGSVCALSITIATWVCWTSIPAIIAAVVNCF